jgi:hypothetical protein
MPVYQFVLQCYSADLYIVKGKSEVPVLNQAPRHEDLSTA